MVMKNNGWKLAAAIAIPVIGGSLIGKIASQSTRTKYKKLKQPTFAPPGWIFPVVWPILYTTMGVAKYIFDQKPIIKRVDKYGNLAYSTQLGLNFLWSFLFFRWNLRGTAFIEIAMLLTSITLTTYFFYQKSKVAGTLMIPYIAWVTFALGLNYSVWQLNKEVKTI